jgi:hypothetical protein
MRIIVNLFIVNSASISDIILWYFIVLVLLSVWFGIGSFLKAVRLFEETSQIGRIVDLFPAFVSGIVAFSLALSYVRFSHEEPLWIGVGFLSVMVIVGIVTYVLPASIGRALSVFVRKCVYGDGAPDSYLLKRPVRHPRRM